MSCKELLAFHHFRFHSYIQTALLHPRQADIMTSYQDDHNIREPRPPPRQRINVTKFFATLNNTSIGSEAAFRSLATVFQDLPETPVREILLQQLLLEASDPSTKVEGVPDSFLDGLERVPKKSLKKNDVCSICNSSFLDDPYPLVVRLPCHTAHIFDLECVRPWLKLHSTCPLDRIDLLQKKVPIPPPVHDEEEWDEDYA